MLQHLSQFVIILHPAGLTGTAPAGGSGIYTYQWQSSSDNVTFNNIGGATGCQLCTSCADCFNILPKNREFRSLLKHQSINPDNRIRQTLLPELFNRLNQSATIQLLLSLLRAPHQPEEQEHILTSGRIRLIMLHLQILEVLRVQAIHHPL